MISAIEGRKGRKSCDGRERFGLSDKREVKNKSRVGIFNSQKYHNRENESTQMEEEGREGGKPVRKQEVQRRNCIILRRKKNKLS